MSRYKNPTRPECPSAEHQQVQHQQAQHQAVLYAAGELPADETAQFESHFAQCPECRLVVEEQRRVEAVLADVPSERPSIATLDAISAAARTHVSHNKSVSRIALTDRFAMWIGLRGGHAPAAGWALAAMLVLAVGMYVVGNDTTDGPVISQDALSWSYDIEMVSSDDDLMSLFDDDAILSDSQWGSDDALSYDLIAVADEIDALAGTMQGF
jgi:anti-sigma-K factor RskA